jgi:8-oxo-dGTP pyrophosphatase MutT (NUDIX family)
MKYMKNNLLAEINKAVKLPYINQKTVKEFLKKLNSKKGLIRDDDPEYHFCCFCAPINIKNKSMYIGHHIKSGLWFPPGGHMDPGETTFQTVKRETQEELGFKITNEKIDLVNLQLNIINTPGITCKIHYDFWYLIHFDKENDFKYCNEEFYTAGWQKIDKVLEIVKNQNHCTIIKDFAQIIFE